MWTEALLSMLSKLDITELFKGKKGSRLRWSAKRSVGGVLAVVAAQQIVENGLSWEAVILALISVIPLSLSMFEKD